VKPAPQSDQVKAFLLELLELERRHGVILTFHGERDAFSVHDRGGRFDDVVDDGKLAAHDLTSHERPTA